MKKQLLACSAATILMLSSAAQADISATATIASDYLFNGVSQTDDGPALQASFDWYNDQGFYAGTWASNVDWGTDYDTNLEWDFYAGKTFSLTKDLTLDAGIAQYTYHGENSSSDSNYAELYSKFSHSNALGTTELNFWYAWDYAGYAGNHIVAMAAHTFTLAENHYLRLVVDNSSFLDSGIKDWDNKSSYQHLGAEYSTSYHGFDLGAALHTTTLDRDTADTRVFFSVSRTFSF